MKEVKSAPLVNWFIADVEKVLEVWIDDQIGHNIDLSRSLTQSNALVLFNPMRADRREKGAEEEFEAGRGCA